MSHQEFEQDPTTGGIHPVTGVRMSITGRLLHGPAHPDLELPGTITGRLPRVVTTEHAWDEFMSDLAARRQHGKEEYGVNQVVGPDVHHDWLQHHYEELLDAAYYVKCQIIARRTQEEQGGKHGTGR
jgi:hypothetical protein